MPIMNWDSTLDIGVTSMNDDHREILDAMNKIYDARAENQPGATINQLVAKLGAVCSRHFADEEALMAKIGYPGIGTHKHLHGQLLERYGRHAAEIKAANGVAPEEFFEFLRFWLTSHIRGIDAKYGAHAHATKAA
jgi:hemerythrin-like metal-binding protein